MGPSLAGRPPGLTRRPAGDTRSAGFRVTSKHSLYSGDCDSLYPVVRCRFRFLLLASCMGPGCALDTFGVTDSIGSSSSTSPTTGSTTQTDSTTESDSLNTSETATTTEDSGSSDATEVTTGPQPACENCDAVGVAAGDDQTCAWNSSGELYCWGKVSGYALGYSLEELNGELRIGDDERPIDMGPVPLDGVVVQADTGLFATCAVLDTGQLRCWGQLGSRAYGHTDTIQSAADAGDVDLGGPVAAVDVGSFSTCALRTNGAVYCWGNNSYGQLGLGHTDEIGDDELPKTAGPVSLGRPAVQVAVDSNHACAILDDGSVRCWGQGLLLGLGGVDTIGDDELPSSVEPVDLGGRRATHISVHGNTCVVVESGDVYCWGLGTLGYGSEPESVGMTYTPDQWGPINVGRKFSRVLAGVATPCGVSGGEVVCWGANYHGGLGDPNYPHCANCIEGCCVTPPDDNVVAVEVGGEAIDVVSGWLHKCALLKDGSVRCWGNGWGGQLGYGDITVHACQLPMQSQSCETEAPCCIGDDETPASAGPVPLQ